MAKRGQGEGTISKRNDGTWWARITVGKDENGKQKRRAFYGKTRQEVQEKLTAALEEANNDAYTEPSKMALAQWNEIWIEKYKANSVRHGTVHEISQKVTSIINPRLEHYDLKDLRTDMIQKFINGLVQDGYVIKTVYRIYNILFNSLTQACDTGLIVRHPAAGVKLPHRKKVDKIVLTQEDQAAFIECAKQYDTGKLLVFILATGLRRGEAVALTWDDVDFEKGAVYVNKTLAMRVDPDDYKNRELVMTPLKTAESNRTIPLSPSIVTMLKELYAEKEMYKARCGDTDHDNNLVFCSEMGDRTRYYAIDHRLEKTLRDIGMTKVKGLSIHSLRHTFAQCGLENGAELNRPSNGGGVNG